MNGSIKTIITEKVLSGGGGGGGGSWRRLVRNIDVNVRK